MPRAARAARGFVYVASLLVACSGACGGGGGGAQPEGGAPGDGGTSDAQLACPPAPLDEWSPPPYRHAQARQPSACSALLVIDFYQSCLGPTATNDGCNQTWGTGQDAAHQTCQTCLVTASSDTLWGPLVDYGMTVSINVAGCIELLDPSQLACSGLVQLADVCQHQACDAACPVSPTDPASFGDWQACVASTGQTGQGECNAYLASAACAEAEDAGPAAACVTGKTFQDDFVAVASVFCGGQPTD